MAARLGTSTVSARSRLSSGSRSSLFGRVVGAAALAVALVLTLAGWSSSPGRGPQTASTPAGRPVLHDGAGIHVVASTWVSDRMVDVTVSTAALRAPVHVRVLVPTHYSATAARRYPSIYLLHGCAAGRPSTGLEYLEWSGNGAEEITARVGAVVVMPEAGGGGFYTNWFNGGRGGPPEWETFHVGQLVPWIDQSFRTVPQRHQRAIAGLSMGGFGAFSYASRHPDLFGAAGSFWGAVDLTNPPDDEATASAVVDACAAADGGSRDSTFGSHANDELNWRAHDPARLVENLRHTKLYLYTGNGQPGPLDPPGTQLSPIEVLAERSTVGLHDVLVAARIPSFFDDYGPGTHTGAYFRRDFEDVLPKLMADFSRTRVVPRRFTYTTADADYTVYGWHVQMHRTAGELSTLAGNGRRGFALTGSGSASVVTPPLTRPGSVHRIVVRTTTTSSVHRVRSGPDGRLSIDVPLGPPNPYQQFTAHADAVGTKAFTTRVTIR
jgi:S-formylglutathione hydrolase FrmB